MFNNISVSCSYYTDEQFNSGAAINDTKFSIVHFNARSLKKNFTKIKDCLDALKCSFDIIAISETWEDQTNPISVYEMSNYNVFSTARTNKKGGGVALYIRDVYDCKLITTNFIAIDNILECVTVEINFEKQKMHQLLVCTEPQVKIYRHSVITSCLLLIMFTGMANSLFVVTLILIFWNMSQEQLVQLKNQ